MKELIVSPSILAADFERLGEEVRAVQAAGAGLLHLDIMDGHFVPNISFGPKVSSFAIKNCSIPADAHLMVTDPLKWAPEFAKIGCEFITFHDEVGRIDETIETLRGLGVRPGIAYNPNNDLASLERVVDSVDLILIMTVFPGFAGQKFLEAGFENLKKAISIRDASSKRPLIAVDGGINIETAKQVVEAGADIVVMGSALFGSMDYAETIRVVRSFAR